MREPIVADSPPPGRSRESADRPFELNRMYFSNPNDDETISMPAFSSSSSSSFSFSSSIGWLVFEDEDEQEDDPVYARKIRSFIQAEPDLEAFDALR